MKKPLLLHNFGKRTITLCSWATKSHWNKWVYPLSITRNSLQLAHFMVSNFLFHVRHSDFNSNKFQPECQLYTVIQHFSQVWMKKFCWWFRPTNAHFNYTFQLYCHTRHIWLWCIQVNYPMSFYLVFFVYVCVCVFACVSVCWVTKIGCMQQRKKPRSHHICLTVLFTFSIFLNTHFARHICQACCLSLSRCSNIPTSAPAQQISSNSLWTVSCVCVFFFHSPISWCWLCINQTINIPCTMWIGGIVKKTVINKWLCFVEHVTFFRYLLNRTCLTYVLCLSGTKKNTKA